MMFVLLVRCENDYLMMWHEWDFYILEIIYNNIVLLQFYFFFCQSVQLIVLTPDLSPTIPFPVLQLYVLVLRCVLGNLKESW